MPYRAPIEALEAARIHLDAARASVDRAVAACERSLRPTRGERMRRRLRRRWPQLVTGLVLTGAVGAGAAWALQPMCTIGPVRQTESDLRGLRSAATSFGVYEGECPSVPDLITQGYLDASTRPRDAWGGAYLVECDGGVVVRSAGPDREWGTVDDLPRERR